MARKYAKLSLTKSRLSIFPETSYSAERQEDENDENDVEKDDGEDEEEQGEANRVLERPQNSLLPRRRSMNLNRCHDAHITRSWRH